MFPPQANHSSKSKLLKGHSQQNCLPKKEDKIAQVKFVSGFEVKEKDEYKKISYPPRKKQNLIKLHSRKYSSYANQKYKIQKNLKKTPRKKKRTKTQSPKKTPVFSQEK